jgi:hypothetical protein
MLYDSARGDFKMMLLGDAVPTRRLSVFGAERYLKLRRFAPLPARTFANLETCVHRYLAGDQKSPSYPGGAAPRSNGQTGRDVVTVDLSWDR